MPAVSGLGVLRPHSRSHPGPHIVGNTGRRPLTPLVQVTGRHLTTAARALAARHVSNPVSVSRSPTGPRFAHRRRTGPSRSTSDGRSLSHGHRERRRVTGEELATPARVV